MINDSKRNIVMFTNINNESVKNLEFGFFFDSDRALFDEEVMDKVKTPGVSVIEDPYAQIAGAAQPFYYLRRENSPSVRQTIMEAIEGFCDKYNVVIISEY